MTDLRPRATRMAAPWRQPRGGAILTALFFLVACFLPGLHAQATAAASCNQWFNHTIQHHNDDPQRESWLPLNPLQPQVPSERPWVWLWQQFRLAAEKKPEDQHELLNHLWFSITSVYLGDRWQNMLKTLGTEEPQQQATLDTCLGQTQDLQGFVATLPNPPPSDYQSYKRWISLNVVTEPMVLWQLRKEINSYQERWRRPARQPVRHYLPPDPLARAPTPRDVARNLLDFPVPSRAAMAQLMAHYAPVISVADPRNVNALGSLAWENGQLTHQPAKPAVYSWPGFVSYRGHRLLQFSYQLWFRKPREKINSESSTADLNYILWRVTLKPDGNVLFYESVRGDGLFYALYPASRGISPRPGQLSVSLYPHDVPNAQQQRVELLIEPDSHLIVRARAFNKQPLTQPYQLLPHQLLLALPEDEHHRSVYTATAAVHGSQPSPAQAFLLGINNFGQQRAPHRLPIGIEQNLYWDDPELPAKILQ